MNLGPNFEIMIKARIAETQPRHWRPNCQTKIYKNVFCFLVVLKLCCYILLSWNPVRNPCAYTIPREMMTSTPQVSQTLLIPTLGLPSAFFQNPKFLQKFSFKACGLSHACFQSLWKGTYLSTCWGKPPQEPGEPREPTEAEHVLFCLFLRHSAHRCYDVFWTCWID